MIVHVLTLFPEAFPGILESSMLRKAREAGILTVNVRNIRDWALDKHHVTDDTPYGGGPGMVMKIEPICAAFDAIAAENPGQCPLRVYLSPEGEIWNQRMAEEFSRLESVILLCGHYEGIDERVRTLCIDREISLGDFVLTGGEIPAMALIDSMARLLPGVLGNDESAIHESFGVHGLLDHPQYTRPEVYRGLTVPEVLLSGHHKRIDEWRRAQSLKRTFERRPDLIERGTAELSDSERHLVEQLRREKETT